MGFLSGIAKFAKAASPYLGPAAMIGTGVLGYKGAKAQNAANAQQAAGQMDFQERMSNTAYQRQVADMKKAGINPMLSAKVGGASSPGGAQARMENTSAAGTAAAMNSAQMANLAANTKKTNAEANVIEKTGLDKAYTDIGLTQAQGRKVKEEALKVSAEINNLKSQNAQIDYLIKETEARTKLLGIQHATTGVQLQMWRATTTKILEDTRIIKMNADIQQALLNAKPSDVINLFKLFKKGK